jgi:MFS family permease
MKTLATRALVATTAIQAAAACAALTIPAIAPVVAANLGVPASMVGTYISLLYVGASTAALAGGGVVLRYGALRLSQACLLACAAGLALMLAVGHDAGALGLVTIGLSAVVLGIGYGPITPASSHVLAKTTSPENMALVFSIKQTGVPARSPACWCRRWQWRSAGTARSRCLRSDASPSRSQPSRCVRRSMPIAILPRGCRPRRW